MGLLLANYNTCQEVPLGIFTASGATGTGPSDACGNCGYQISVTSPSNGSASGSMTITIPYSSLIYNGQDVWVAITSAIHNGGCGGAYMNLYLAFYNASGQQISTSPTFSFAPSAGTTVYFFYAMPIPNGTSTIDIVTEVNVSYGVGALNQTCSTTGSVGIAQVQFYSTPPQYYIEPLYFYNQSITYTIPLNITTSDYFAYYTVSGGPSNLNSYSTCVVASNGTFCANVYYESGESSISEVYFTGNANSTYQVTWSELDALILFNSSCALDNILAFNVVGYNNILNPAEYSFTIQTPINGTISKSYTLLVPAGYFKIVPSYSLSCSSSPCTSGFTTFTITIDFYTSSGVLVASQQVNVLNGETFVPFDLEDYYGGQTLTVEVNLDVNASLSQNVTLTMNFEYEVQAQT